MENNIYDISDMHDDAISLCDKYDFLASVCIGGCAGAIDVFFVGEPGFSKLGKATDKAMDNIVMRFAKAVGWSPKDGKQGNVASAIGFLENKYRVNYDQSHTGQVGRRFQLTPKNHHLKSLAHSPDIIGLFFSILNQFTNTSSFVSNGKLITIQNSDTQFELQGHNFISRLYCGFCNWVGHIMSDIAGSSGSRGKQDCGRGMGVPVPFMELFQLCDFGKLRGKNEETTTLARVMEEVFVNGYDARYAVAMSIPVVLQELMIKIFWTIKARYYKKRPLAECVPNKSHGDLRIMILVGNATLCLLDGADAVIRSKGNAFCCIMRMNIIAWYRLFALVLSEIKIRYGKEFAHKLLQCCRRWMGEDLQGYYSVIDASNHELKRTFNTFLEQQLKEYKSFLNDLYGYSILNEGSQDAVAVAAGMARKAGVPESDIYMVDDLDAYFRNRE